MKRGEDTVKLAIALGQAIDAEGKKSGPYTTVQIAGCMARLAASAGAICNRSDPSAGVQFVFDEFLTELQAQCHAHGIRGVTFIEVPMPPPVSDDPAAH